jgi:biopolymer transport protein ExbB
MSGLKRAGAVLALGMALGVEAAWAQQAPITGSGLDVSAQDRKAPAKTRLQGAFKELKYLHTAGGGCMWGIDACMLVGVAFVLDRLYRLRRKALLPGSLVKAAGPALEAGNLNALAEASRRHARSTLGKVLVFLAGSKDITREERETGANEIASRDLDVHRMMCLPLAAICGIAPLIGLLGTVVGIRECFRDVALSGEMGNPAMLAGGIEKALITTIYGLVVAIPTLAAYNLFRLRINLIANEMEEVLSGALARKVFNSGSKS